MNGTSVPVMRFNPQLTDPAIPTSVMGGRGSVDYAPAPAEHDERPQVFWEGILFVVCDHEGKLVCVGLVQREGRQLHQDLMDMGDRGKPQFSKMGVSVQWAGCGSVCHRCNQFHHGEGDFCEKCRAKASAPSATTAAAGEGRPGLVARSRGRKRRRPPRARPERADLPDAQAGLAEAVLGQVLRLGAR